LGEQSSGMSRSSSSMAVTTASSKLMLLTIFWKSPAKALSTNRSRGERNIVFFSTACEPSLYPCLGHFLRWSKLVSLECPNRIPELMQGSLFDSHNSVDGNGPPDTGSLPHSTGPTQVWHSGHLAGISSVHALYGTSENLGIQCSFFIMDIASVDFLTTHIRLAPQSHLKRNVIIKRRSRCAGPWDECVAVHDRASS
jgi:hypothetical protein